MECKRHRSNLIKKINTKLHSTHTCIINRFSFYLNETKIDYETHKNWITNQNHHLSKVKNLKDIELCKVSSGYSGVMTYSRHLPVIITWRYARVWSS